MLSVVSAAAAAPSVGCFPLAHRRVRAAGCQHQREIWTDGGFEYPRSVTERPMVYVSGALSAAADLDAARRLYERIADTCVTAGMQAFLPHLSNDPEHHPEVDADEVFRRDLKALSAADLVVAYLGIASTGVGAELAIAADLGIPILAIYSNGDRVSRFVLGLLRAHNAQELLVEIDDLQTQLPAKLAEMSLSLPTASRSDPEAVTGEE